MPIGTDVTSARRILEADRFQCEFGRDLMGPDKDGVDLEGLFCARAKAAPLVLGSHEWTAFLYVEGARITDVAVSYGITAM